MWAHACYFTDDQVFEAALITLITTSQRRIIHGAFPSQCLLKFQSLGPIRACSEHFLVITQSVLLTNPAHQSVITSSPPNTQMLSGHSHELVYWQAPVWLMPWGAWSNGLTYQTHLSSRWWRDSRQICPHAAKDKIELKIEQNSE